MTFKQLLKAKDEALAHAEECSAAFELASEAVQKATADHEAAQALLMEAHKALHERLIEKGHHSINEGGTVTVYQATDPEDGVGWKSYHPIPGDE